MTSKHRLLILFLLTVISLLFVSCLPRVHEEYQTSVPVRVLDPDTHEVDLDTAIARASSLINKTLPDAYLAGISYVGRCDEVEDLYGKLNLTFVQEKRSILSTSVRVADVSIDTNRQNMDIRIWDATDKYFIAKPLILQNDLSIQEIASITSAQLDKLKVERCDIMLTRLEDYWLVVCTSWRSRICEFKVDIKTGKVVPTD